MTDTNYFSGIVKILETPKQYLINDRTQVTRFRVELSQKRKNTIVYLIFWGNLAHEVKKFYKVNDYILIEGYTSLRPNKFRQINSKNEKQVFISVIRIYPILLNANKASTKI